MPGNDQRWIPGNDQRWIPGNDQRWIPGNDQKRIAEGFFLSRQSQASDFNFDYAQYLQ
jgi:hypothetical protein